MKITISFYILFFILLNSVDAQNIHHNGFVSPRCFEKDVKFDFGPVDKIIIQDVYINGSKKKYTFLFDTGSELSYVNYDILKDLEFEKLGAIRSTDEVASENKEIGMVNFIINRVRFNEIITCVDTSFMPVLGDIDGILGMNLIKLCVWKLDLINNEILITDNVKNVKDLNAYYEQKIKLIKGVPFVGACINEGMLRGDMLLDLGDNTFISLNNNSSNNRLINNRQIPTITSNSYVISRSYSSENVSDDLNKVKIGSLNKFNLGKQKRNKNLNLENSINNSIVSLFDSTSWTNSVLGAKILNNYSIILDFNKRKLYSKIENEDFTYRTFGIGIYPKDGKYYISTVWDGTLAQNLGVKHNDQIIKINNLELENSEYSVQETYSMIEDEMAKNKEIIIKFKNKKGEYKLYEEFPFTTNR